MFRCFVAAPAFRAKAGGALEEGLRIRLAQIVWAALAVAVLSGAAWLLVVAAGIGGLSGAGAVAGGLAWVGLDEAAVRHGWVVGLEVAAVLAAALVAPRAKARLR